MPSSRPSPGPAVSALNASRSSTVQRNWARAPMVRLLTPEEIVTPPRETSTLVASDGGAAGAWAQAPVGKTAKRAARTYRSNQSSSQRERGAPVDEEVTSVRLR